MEYFFGACIMEPSIFYSTYYSYVYRITHILNNKHYYGSRYCKMSARYSLDPLEDLKNYQTSSSNVEFKEELKLYPERFKFKIIKIFNTHIEALIYEFILHKKFNVGSSKNFYNFSNSTLFKRFNSIDEVSEFYNTKWKIYSYDFINEHIIEYNDTYYNLLHIIPDNVLYNLCVRGCSTSEYFYKNKNECINMNQWHVLYYYKNNRVNKISFRLYYSNKVLGFSYISYMLGNKKNNKKYNGYYTTYEECEKENKFYNIYFYNHTSKVIEDMQVSYISCTGIIPNGRNLVSQLFHKGKNTTHGYYSSKESCEYDYQIYILYSVKDNIIIETKIFRKDLNNFLGSDAMSLIRGKQKSIRGYYLDKNNLS